MKKLIPALCMLLVAAALLGTSTFAWFSMNTMVEANGMSVKAETSANLVIKNSTGDWTRAAAASHDSMQTLKPASTSRTDGVLSAGKFFYAENPDTVDYDTGEAAANTRFAAAPVTANDDNEYVSCNTFTIGVEGEKTFNSLYVSNISVSNNTQAIAKALRVAVVTANEALIFAPVTGADLSYRGVAAADVFATALAATPETISVVGADADLGPISNAAELEVTVYVWFEGQDESCISGNAVDVSELSVSVQFTAA